LQSRRRLTRDKDAAAAVEIQDFTRQKCIPGARCDALGEQCIEDEAAGRRDRKAALASRLRQPARNRPILNAREVGTFAPKALRTEIVRHATARDELDSFFNGWPAAAQLLNADAKAIGGERTAPELAAVSVNFEHLEFRAPHGAPIGIAGRGSR